MELYFAGGSYLLKCKYSATARPMYQPTLQIKRVIDITSQVGASRPSGLLIAPATTPNMANIAASLGETRHRVLPVGLVPRGSASLFIGAEDYATVTRWPLERPEVQAVAH